MARAAPTLGPRTRDLGPRSSGPGVDGAFGRPRTAAGRDYGLFPPFLGMGPGAAHWGPGRRRGQGRRADLAQICAKSRAARQPVSSPRTSRAGRRGSSGAGAATVRRTSGSEGGHYTHFTPLARARARRPRGAGNRIAHTGAVGPGTVGGADLLSGPLDIAPCGAALGCRGRTRGPRAYQGAGIAGIAGLVGRAPGSPGAGASWAAGGRPGGIGRQGRHRAGVWRRGGRRRVRRPGGQTAPWRPVWRSPGRLGAVGHPRYRGPARAGRHPAAGPGLC